jgi:hypothetical protein
MVDHRFHDREGNVRAYHVRAKEDLQPTGVVHVVGLGDNDARRPDRHVVLADDLYGGRFGTGSWRLATYGIARNRLDKDIDGLPEGRIVPLLNGDNRVVDLEVTRSLLVEDNQFL